VRDLTDAEFDALFGRAWETAIPGYRGPDSPHQPAAGTASAWAAQPGSEVARADQPVIGALFSGQTTAAQPPVDVGQRKSLDASTTPLAELPVVDDYRWNDCCQRQHGRSPSSSCGGPC
jgi:hypothetical protein